MLSRRARVAASLLCFSGLTGWLTPSGAEAESLAVHLGTSELSGVAADLAFDLLDNDGAANNRVIVSGFTTTGLLGPASSVGDVSGDLPGAVTIRDTAGKGELLQMITFGDVVDFRLDATTAFAGGVPDRFSLTILDPATSFALVTTDLSQDALFTLDLDGTPTGTLFVATSTTPTATVSVTPGPRAIPAPASLGLLALGLPLILGVAARRRRGRARQEDMDMGGSRIQRAFRAAAIVVAALVLGTAPAGWAASHREAPITALDHPADITDFFAFVGYDPAAPHTVTLILDVDPFLEPSNGPNYFPFDPEVLYTIRIDNDKDAVEDVVFEVRFRTEIRLPNLFTGFVGGIAGILPITALDGPGSEGFSLRQKYTVTMKRRAHGTLQTVFTTSTALNGKDLIAVPSNVGPRTMPNYPAFAAQGIYELGNRIKVFAGTVDDPFYIDLGAAFDSLNFRPSAFATGVPGVLSDRQDADDTQNFAPDDVSGFNVNTIAIQVPVDLLTQDGGFHPADDPRATIGAWGATYRARVKVQPSRPGGAPELSANFQQIQRMGNALVNELIIGTGFKDKWSMSQPKDDAQFSNFLLDPVLAEVFQSIGIAVPPPPRTDLLVLAQYRPPICPACTTARLRGPIADLLRLNTGIPPAFAARRRLGVLAGDLAGYPNGRRVFDDVFDISARVVAGVLVPVFNRFPNNRLGDAVNANDVLPYRDTFPYLKFAQSGRDSRHIDPTEPGCTDPRTFTSKNCPIN